MHTELQEKVDIKLTLGGLNCEPKCEELCYRKHFEELQQLLESCDNDDRERRKAISRTECRVDALKDSQTYDFTERDLIN